jgi:hypothetical protein
MEYEHSPPPRDADTIHVCYPRCFADISEHKYLILDGDANLVSSNTALQILVTGCDQSASLLSLAR